VIVTVTMNAALDRILTVPNFQRGQRHRASEKMTLAGGKGITVARALKALGVPVVATGLVGGRNGRRILEELAEEAILNDFVRIGDESRTSTAVSDPTSGEFTEVMEWGPLVHPYELEVLLEKVDYLSRGAEMVVFAGSLPRGVDDDFYAEAIRQLNRAEPFLVSPNQQEAEAVVGQEFSDERDFVDALDRLGDLGARSALITYELGCFASVREERGQARSYRAAAPHLEAVSRVGAGAVLLAGFISAWLEHATPEEAVRKAVAAGAASTLGVGAGLFDPRDVGRILPDVVVSDLTPVAGT
jgi:1-phosphofructokinase/tagatose 6-phosphate kinase